MHHLVAAAAALAALTAAEAAATEWSADPDTGSLTWSVRFEDRQLAGEFAAFTPEIVFDPADLAGSHVTVTVDIGSVATETPEVTAETLKPDWFDAEAFPTAVFEAATFRALGGDAYEADGTLTIRDIAQPVTLPFTFAIDGDTAAIAGGVSIDRLDHGVGQGDWAIDDIVGFEVEIGFTLAATRAD
jgi:polyisoprenoid-binding protein YceI